MANSYFQFKLFTVHQQNCAMKVSTDSCIFGALVADFFAEKSLKETAIISHFLDIGTGTGLLSLMLAQKTDVLIDAVEIDAPAFIQAAENFTSSPFAKRITIFKEDILKYPNTKKYDGIICNPPFYERDLKSVDAKKNAAKHDTSLTFIQLIYAVKSLLKPSGLFAVLLPFHRLEEFIKEALLQNLFLQKKILLRHTLQHPYFRGVLIFSNIRIQTSVVSELSIKNSEEQYTPEFINLLKDYYLYL